MKCFFNDLFRKKKVFVLSVVIFVFLIVAVAMPTLSRYKNRTSNYDISVWDGSVADSYRSGNGTFEDPYVISDGSELAYFSEQLKTNNYENTYFILNNDIVLNDGVFKYQQDGDIKYIKDGVENIIVPGEDNDIINEFSHLNNFKGFFDGGYYSIYGVYIDDVVDNKNALFTNLEGSITNLYIENSVIYGGNLAAGVVSDAYNSKISNILYDGYVIGNENFIENVENYNIDNITKIISNEEVVESLTIDNYGYISGQILDVTLSGIYENVNEDAILKINEEVISLGNFEVNLGNNFNGDISFNYFSDSDVTFNLKDLKVTVTYKFGNAAGIVSVANNTILENIINRADVSASVYASGISNFLCNDSSFNNVDNKDSFTNIYNNGKIYSDYLSSGLISNVNNNQLDVVISNSYNSGELVAINSAMIGNVFNNKGNVTLNNLFNVSDNYAIFSILSSDVTVNKSFVVFEKFINNGELLDGEFELTSVDNLYDKTFVKTNLLFEEFEDGNVIDSKVWIFDEASLPILYFDDLNDPIANFHVSNYTWDSFTDSLDTLKFSDAFAFSIEEVDLLNPIKEIYYYVSNEKDGLSIEELENISDWKTYEDIVDITEEGFYVIYAKIIDYNDEDNVTYLNTDLLVLDLTGSVINILTSNGDSWDKFKTDLDNYYINDELDISIEAFDDLSGINKIYYYVSDTVLNLEEVEQLSDWVLYENSFKINLEKNIVYVKVIDNCDYVTYANSDLILLRGYLVNRISPGMNGENVEELYITNKSKVSINFVYQDDNNYLSEHKHQLLSNVLLPQNTKITLIDKVNSKVYSYITTDDDYGYYDCVNDSCVATYSLELFSEVGTDIKFNESDYSGTINENFVVVLDFIDTEIKQNIDNVVISMKLDSANLHENRSTLVASLRGFSIIAEDCNASLSFTSNFKDTIYYSTNDEYNIGFSAMFNYKYLNDIKIYDTLYEDKIIGLSVRMVDKDGNIVNSKYLKNVMFMIGDKKYVPSSDGIVRINLENGLNNINKTLQIKTFIDNSELEKGNYKFILGTYVAYDGIYSNNAIETLEIPVVVGENLFINDFGVSVVMNSEDRIIENNLNEFNFDILVDNSFNYSDVKVSLYKKKVLSAYDQNYEQIDLGEYLENVSLEKYNNFTYYALKSVNSENKFNLQLNTGLLEKNGYMFVFEFYNNEELIGKLNKKFIVK